jgi:hypothetical protein
MEPWRRGERTRVIITGDERGGGYTSDVALLNLAPRYKPIQEWCMLGFEGKLLRDGLEEGALEGEGKYSLTSGTGLEEHRCRRTLQRGGG